MSGKVGRVARKCALGAVSGVLVLSVALMSVGVQEPVEALAGPQLTASSDTSRTSAVPAADAGQDAQVDASNKAAGAPLTPKLDASSSSPSKAGGASKKDDSSKAGANVGDVFSMDADCAACHSKAAEKMADKGYIGELHQNLDCVFCHDNEAELTAAHAEKYSAKQASRVVALNKTTVDEAVCLSCHGDRETLVEGTADATVLTDSKGTTVNPHDLPDIDKHANITCGSCHKMHDDKTSDEAATNTCLNCHHDNVYECYTCHK